MAPGPHWLPGHHCAYSPDPESCPLFSQPLFLSCLPCLALWSASGTFNYSCPPLQTGPVLHVVWVHPSSRVWRCFQCPGVSRRGGPKPGVWASSVFGGQQARRRKVRAGEGACRVTRALSLHQERDMSKDFGTGSFASLKPVPRTFNWDLPVCSFNLEVVTESRVC